MKLSRLYLRSLPPSGGFTLVEQAIIVAVLGVVAAISTPNVMAMLNRMRVEQAMTEVRNALSETQREAVRGNKMCSVTFNFVEGKITGPCLVTGDRKLPRQVDIATNLIPDTAITQDGDESGIAAEADQPVQLVFTDVPIDLGITDQNNTQIAMLPLEDQAPDAPKAAMVIQIISAAGGNCKSKGKGQKHCKTPNVSPGPSVSPTPRGDDDDDDDGDLREPTITAREIPVQYGVLGNPQFAIALPSASFLPADPSGKIVLFLPGQQQSVKKCVAISQTLGLTRIGDYEGPLAPSDITTEGVCTAMKWTQQ